MIEERSVRRHFLIQISARELLQARYASCNSRIDAPLIVWIKCWKRYQDLISYLKMLGFTQL